MGYNSCVSWWTSLFLKHLLRNLRDHRLKMVLSQRGYLGSFNPCSGWKSPRSVGNSASFHILEHKFNFLWCVCALELLRHLCFKNIITDIVTLYKHFVDEYVFKTSSCKYFYNLWIPVLLFDQSVSLLPSLVSSLAVCMSQLYQRSYK